MEAKPIEYSLLLVDTYYLLPSPSQEDREDVIERYKAIQDVQALGIGGDLYYGYETDLVMKVQTNIIDFNVASEKRNVNFKKVHFLRPPDLLTFTKKPRF